MILAMDTSTQWMGLALFDGWQIFYEKMWRTNRQHTVELVPAVQTAMEETGIEKSALRAVAVALGPGSFTSLRIGLSVAKGLSLALHIPVIGVPSLDIIANGLELSDKPLIAVLKAGRGRWAAQRYQSGDEEWEPQGNLFITTALELEQIITSPTIICGEIEEEELRVLKRRWRNALVASPAHNLRRPAVLAELAWRKFKEGCVDNAASLAPIYLHKVSSAEA